MINGKTLPEMIKCLKENDPKYKDLDIGQYEIVLSDPALAELEELLGIKKQ